MGPTLKEKLGERQAAGTILINSEGKPWTSDGFRTSWRKACNRAGIKDVSFHDIRGTAVTRLALAGASVPEIAAITGHSLRDAAEILDAHYLGPDVGLAESAMRKLDRNRPPRREKTTIYFLKCGEFVKIGKAANVRLRLNDLGVGSPQEQELLLVIEEASPRTERRLHHRFASLHHKGEWFRLEGELAEMIEKKRQENDSRKMIVKRVSTDDVSA